MEQPASITELPKVAKPNILAKKSNIKETRHPQEAVEAVEAEGRE